MGMSVSSVATYTGQVFPVLQGTVGTGGPSRVRGQDWRSQCCVVCGRGRGVVGVDLLPGMEVVWVEWDRGGCRGEGCIWLWCVGVGVGRMWDGST